MPYSQAEFIRMIHLISRKYKEDTTDSMLFTPIVENIISKMGSENVCIWAQSPGADVDLGSRPAFKLLVDAARKINRGDTIFVTSTPPHFVFMILMIRCFRNFKIIFQVQDLYPDILKILDWRFQVLYYLTIIPSYFLYKLVNVFLTISDEIKDHLIQQYNISGKDIFIEENWTDIECVNLFEKPLTNRIVYIGNIGRAHDYNYFLKYIMTETVTTEIVIKTDNSSKIKLSNSDKIDANGLKQVNLPPFIHWNHTRYSKDELSEFLSGFDYSIVFLGRNFDKILFPCKIYSSLAMLMPVIFFGPKDSFVNIWLEKYNLGFHYSTLKENYKNLDFYRKNIDRYNKENPIEKKIEHITQIILK